MNRQYVVDADGNFYGAFTTKHEAQKFIKIEDPKGVKLGALNREDYEEHCGNAGVRPVPAR